MIVPREMSKVKAAIYQLDEEIAALQQFSNDLESDLVGGLPETGKAFEFK